MLDLSKMFTSWERSAFRIFVFCKKLCHILTVMRSRTLAICAAASALIPVGLISFSLLNRDVNGFTAGFPLARRFHVGVFDGALWFHSHSLPYTGGTVAIVREGFPSPRTTALDFPGVYYRFIRLPLHPEPLWTLRLSLGYPVVLALVFPLLWVRRFWRKAHNRVAGRIALPAPTPPDMRVRIRRFRSD